MPFGTFLSKTKGRGNIISIKIFFSDNFQNRVLETNIDFKSEESLIMLTNVLNIENIKQFSKYGLVGAGGTLAHYTFLIILVNFADINASISAFLGAFVGALVNYALNYKYTFLSVKKHKVALPQFITVACLSMFLSAWIVQSITMYGYHYLIGQIIATALLLPIGFVINKKMVF